MINWARSNRLDPPAIIAVLVPCVEKFKNVKCLAGLHFENPVFPQVVKPEI